MEILGNIVQYILDMGAGVFLPIIMFLLGMVIRMPVRKAISAALLLGVAFTGMNIIIGFMTGAISPAASELVENTGRQLNVIDLGWTPVAAVTWAWPYAFLLFPIQIVVNIFLLAVGFTKTLNVDMWNVWAKVFCGVLMATVSGSLVFAFVVCAVMVVIELKFADVSQKQIFEITGIPGVSFPHAMALQGVIIAPLNRLLDFVPGINKVQIDSKVIRERIGIFGENHVLGFILGLFIGLLAGYDVQSLLILAIQASTGLLLFPMVAKLFMQALAPISDAASEFMKKRFPGKEIYIGLDWPFLAGSPELWVTMILLVPVILGLSLVLPGNSTLPFGGILMVCYAPVALYICNANVLRMFICGVITMPVYLWVATYIAPTVTTLARAAGGVDIPADQLVTWNGVFCPEFFYSFAQLGQVFAGNASAGVVTLPAFLLLLAWYFKYMWTREKKATARVLGEDAA
ncbi:MAG: PTS galactitol transporter subunit IIC [Clostridiales Family XIII bacterium]|nr:PTS galactitol transporter subunit IIC [Clostridiales Family XIII bacterium]